MERKRKRGRERERERRDRERQRGEDKLPVALRLHSVLRETVCVCARVRGKLEINRRTAEELTHNNLTWKSAKKSNKTHTLAVLAPRPQLHVHSYLQVSIHLCEIVAVLTVQ